MKQTTYKMTTACAGVVLAILSTQAMAADKLVSIATGGIAGIYFPLGGALGKLWTDSIPGVQATAEVTGASVENTRLVVSMGMKDSTMPSSEA